MKYYSLLKRGNSHADYCEDNLFVHSWNDEFVLAAVFDGCSSGEDSYFASALLAKITKKVCLSYTLSSQNIDIVLQEILFLIVENYHKQANTLALSTNELLSTILISITDINTKQSEIICIGDGFFAVNGQAIEIDQQNKPNYLAYNLSDIAVLEKFNQWYTDFPQKYSFYNVNDLSIATDGILSFVIHSNDQKLIMAEEKNKITSIEFLIKDTKLNALKIMQYRKYNMIKRLYGLINYDDLAMIRIIL